MKHIKIKKFSYEANKAKLTDNVLIETLNTFMKLNRDEQLKYSLGAGLYKLRIATKEGRGKSGGSRGILALKMIREFIGFIYFLRMIKETLQLLSLKN